MNEKLLYVSSGRKNGLYTLRHQWCAGGYMQDYHIMTLAKDRDVATKKAWDYFEEHCKPEEGWEFDDDHTFDLYEWGHGKPVWVMKALQMIEHNAMPFGAHHGELIEDQQDDYVLWWAKKDATNDNIVIQTLVKKFQEIATKRDLFKKLEEENAAREAQKKISQYVGETGKRQNFNLKMVFYRPFDGFYGPAVVVGFVDEKENKIVYIGSADFSDLEIGDSVSFEAKVTKHNEYMGEKQTVVNRPTKKIKVEKDN